ncbi:hypothetical protein A2801_02220 [Candidatus Woesebacteria bacterium RIFCSPHIGHO2_01_FULL_41_10]|uniref:Undecaprenyl-phosphate alpha-N-acetylglucosaminyl 1-phosphate transferase n=1 Tax=Candidatus Woesebacteria bacterium RIFCSPHIGHO2_01_FULL_41_10 TaxID=1802500 RepID=A0A1F7YPP8_9BACT|nr:MAG: hypothetical protein A2801_02220 [Candidatus Woesebacteria bacterium RIFCSPHIGHO2_01_FULL_41_10]
MSVFEILFVAPALISAVIAFAVTPFVIRFAWKIGIIDDPKKNKHPKVLHTKPTPRGGGLAISIAIILVSILFLPIDKHLRGILVGVLILSLVGILDDKYNLNPYIRLIVQFLAASAPIAAGIGIAFVSNPFTGGIIDLSHPQFTFELFGEAHSVWILSDLFALFWIVTLMNFLNMGAKGVPGQLPGVVGIAAITIALMSLKFSADITEWPVTILAAITAGAFLGFLPWNMYPQRIMPSFGGSNVGGFMLAVLSILTTTKLGVLSVVLAVPLVDTGYTVLRRVFSGKSPVWGDRGHLHHRLIDKAGFSQKQVAYFYWSLTALLGLVGLYLNTQLKVVTIISLVLLIGGAIIWLTYQKQPSD